MQQQQPNDSRNSDLAEAYMEARAAWPDVEVRLAEALQRLDSAEIARLAPVARALRALRKAVEGTP